MLARDLGYDHVGTRVSWPVPEPDALLLAETPIGDLCWISHTDGAVVLGVTFLEPLEPGEPARHGILTRVDGHRYEATTDDYWLPPDTSITLHDDEPDPTA